MLGQPAFDADALHLFEPGHRGPVMLHRFGEVLDEGAGIEVSTLSAELKPVPVDTALDQLAVP